MQSYQLESNHGFSLSPEEWQGYLFSRRCSAVHKQYQQNRVSSLRTPCWVCIVASTDSSEGSAFFSCTAPNVFVLPSSVIYGRYGDPFTTFSSDRVNEGAPGTPTYPRLYEGVYPRRESWLETAHVQHTQSPSLIYIPGILYTPGICRPSSNTPRCRCIRSNRVKHTLNCRNIALLHAYTPIHTHR